MIIKFNARKFNLTEDVKERFQKKLDKLDKFFPADTEAAVVLYELKNGERVEVTIYKGGTIFRAEETEKDVACALDRVMDVLERQIRKNRTRLEKKNHIKRTVDYSEILPLDEEVIKITKSKRFDIRPMSAEEAVLQMNLLSHEFYLFKNVNTGNINVVYKRKDNEYGLIEPLD